MSSSKKLSFLLIFLIISFGYSIYAANTRLNALSQKLNNAQEDLSVEQEKGLIITDMQRRLVAFKDLKETLASVLPEDKNQAQIIAEINQIAKDSNLSVDNLSFSDSGINAGATSGTNPTQTKAVEGLAGVFELPIVISGIKNNTNNIAGSTSKSGIEYSQALSFIRGFESNRRSMQIKSVSLSPQYDSANNKYTYSLQINLSVYIK